MFFRRCLVTAAHAIFLGIKSRKIVNLRPRTIRKYEVQCFGWRREQSRWLYGLRSGLAQWSRKSSPKRGFHRLHALWSETKKHFRVLRPKSSKISIIFLQSVNVSIFPQKWWESSHCNNLCNCAYLVSRLLSPFVTIHFNQATVYTKNSLEVTDSGVAKYGHKIILSSTWALRGKLKIE